MSKYEKFNLGKIKLLSGKVLKSAKLIHKSLLFESTNFTLEPFWSIIEGVAINVFEGHKTVFPFKLKYCIAANAPPDQELNAAE